MSSETESYWGAEENDPTTGEVAVTHDTGGTDALRVTDAGEDGIDNVTIRAYVASEFAASAATARIRGTTYTNDQGRWTKPLYLSPGVAYTLTFSATGFDFDPQDVTPEEPE